jgi:tetratricopeptide (TPR) repeat protein
LQPEAADEDIALGITGLPSVALPSPQQASQRAATVGNRGRADDLNAVISHLTVLVLWVILPISALAADRGSERQQGGGALSITAVSTPDLLAQSDRLTQRAATLYKQGRYADAEPYFQEALAIQEKALGPDDPDVAASLNNLAGVYREEGRYGEAEPLYRHALAIREKLLGRDNPTLASNLNNLAVLFSNEGRFRDAEPLFRRALALKEKASGPEDPDVARTLNNLAQLYRVQGLYAQAEPLCKRGLAILEKVLGPHHPDVATSLNNLAQLYWAQGRYGEAEPLYMRALALRERAFGSDHPAVTGSLNNLAELYRMQHRYGEAEPLYRRALAMREKLLGSEHPDVATSLHNMAALYEAQGQYGGAEPWFRRALTIREKALGSDHPDVATSLNKLAEVYEALGRDSEVEPLFRRALAIREEVFGADHPDVAESLNNLAFLYDALGRYSEAESLFRRALAMAEKTLGPENPDVAPSLNNMAVLLSHEARYGEAEPLYRRSLGLEERALGPDHPDVARSLNNLAAANRAQGRNFVAEPLYRRALKIREKALGPDHPDVAISLTNLAALKGAQGCYDEAEHLYRRALAIREKALGPDNLAVAASLNNLAELYRAESQIGSALAASTRAVDILEKNLVAGKSQTWRGGLAEQRRDRGYFAKYVRIAYAAAAGAPQQTPSAAEETLRAAQLAQASGTAQAAAAMAAGIAAGTDPLAAALRERLDLSRRRRQLDTDVLNAASRPSAERNPAQEDALQVALKDIARHLDALDDRIAIEFPGYAELSNPKPVSFEAAQGLLGRDEALLVYLSTADETWLWAVRRGAIAFYRLGIGAEALANEVTALRTRLDPRDNPNLEPYPATRGYGLYQKILAPAVPLLTGVHHLLIIPDGALQSLPPGVLVTKPPQKDPENLEQHRNIAWLAREYAITVLPAVSSLRAVRQFPAPRTASARFLGIGDPALRGGASVVRLANLGPLKAGGAAENFPVLRETADELRTIGNPLGASDDELLLGERASEPMLRQMPLESYKVIEFATPVLISGELKGIAEPALVLTPSAGTQPENDGLLTASKIAALKLDADWIILSACNTAAVGGSPGAEGLSWLAKAFFYAGARGLLVSHWRAPSAGAVMLTTGIFAELAKDPSIGRAEALRRSMMAMLDPKNSPEFAHPSAWAAFVLAGEGGGER